MRKLTRMERRIAELLAQGIRPKRNGIYSFCILRNDSLASCESQEILCGAHNP